MAGMREWLEALRMRYEKTVFVNRNHAEEFRNSEIVAKLQGEGVVIKEIERFHLPEVTCLICNSNVSLVGEEIFKKYEAIAPLYREGNIRKIALECLSGNWDLFKSSIVPYLDMTLIKTFKGIINETFDFIMEKEKEWQNNDSILADLPNQIKRENSNLKKLKRDLEEILKLEKNKEVDTKSQSKTNDDIEKIDELVKPENNKKESKKKQKDKNTIEIAIKKSEKKLNELKAQIENLKEVQKVLQSEIDKSSIEEQRLEPYLELIERAEQNYDISLRSKKRACYEYISNISYKEEKDFIEMFIRKEFVENVFRKALESPKLITNVLNILKGNKYKTKNIQIIISMIEAGAINSDCIELKEFIEDNPEDLREYLLKNFKCDIEQLEKDSVFREWFNIALRRDLVYEDMIFTAIWDEIENVEVWRYISDYIKDENDLAKLVSGARGRVLRSFLEFLMDSDINIPVFLQAVAKQKQVNSDLIFRVTQTYEQKLAKANREMRRANNRLKMQENANATKVFTAMYEPMEHLELLTYDIKKFDGHIKKSTIVNQLMDCIRRFRKGLDNLEVHALEEFEYWKKQIEVDYNSDLHRYEDGNLEMTEKVYIKTLGYKYTDEENEERLEYAKVVPVKE